MDMNDFNLNDFHEKLFALRDEAYKNFNAALLPNVDGISIIGVRMPVLRKFAKNFFAAGGAEAFLNCLPHEFHEENLLHAILVSEMKDYDACLAAVKKFLPYVNDWGVCDTFSPKIFKRYTGELEAEIFNWLHSDEEFTVRFGLSMLLKFYLDENFDAKYLQWAADVRLEKYYVQMMTAWFFATALAKHFDETKIYLEERRLSAGVHRKTIQKALESFRISEAQKEYLRGLR